MAPKRHVKVINPSDYKKITLNDAQCPVCESILIEPITLPCSHSFCSCCFEESIQNANLVCPFCRIRVASWLRSAKRGKNLINETFWKSIQLAFSSEVQNKIKKSDVSILPLSANSLHPIKKQNNAGLKTISNQNPSTSSISKTSQSAPSDNKKPLVFNNLPKKEFTCRIMCQNEVQVKPQNLNKPVLKQIGAISLESGDSSRDSIGSECIYFKPIDYRHNPPSQKYAPIKVPTKRATSSVNVQITAPSGQNQITINHLESAFARLLCINSKEETETKLKQPQAAVILSPSKRKINDSSDKLKKLKVNDLAPLICNFEISSRKSNLRNNCLKILNDESTKKMLQEKADFEFARRLHEELNRNSKYSTRSRISKRGANARRQVAAEVK